jgi:hypothetical protein
LTALVGFVLDYYGVAAPPEAALVGWGKPWLLQDDCGLIAMVQLPSGHYGMAAFWPFLLRSAWFRRAATPDDTSSPGAIPRLPRYLARSFGYLLPRRLLRRRNSTSLSTRRYFLTFPYVSLTFPNLPSGKKLGDTADCWRHCWRRCWRHCWQHCWRHCWRHSW